MKPVVFLGPSLARGDAAALLEADYRGPAAAGDILRAVRTRPSAIVLIDGVFARVPAVWHKELLHALDEGIPVYGAASMGALRAAELRDFGMVGVGSIYARYASAALEDDDEVAVLHASAQFAYRALSDAMINLRDGLALAVTAKVIGAEAAAALEAAAKTLHYPHRSWSAMLKAGAACGIDTDRLHALRDWRQAHQPDTKRDDARAVLHRVAHDLSTAQRPPRVAFQFERSVFFEQLAEAVGSRTPAAVETPALVEQAKLNNPGHDWQRAILRAQLRREARRRGHLPSAESRQRALVRLCQRWGLQDDAALRAWCASRAIDETCLQRLVTDTCLLDAAVAEARPEIEQAFLDELKNSETWPSLVAATQGAPDRLDTGIDFAAAVPRDAGVTLATLLAWYAAHVRAPGEDLADHAALLGFASETAFHSALLRAFLAAASDEERTGSAS